MLLPWMDKGKVPKGSKSWTSVALLILAGCGANGPIRLQAVSRTTAVERDPNVALTSPLATGDADCLNGGLQVESFYDVDKNGIYDASVDSQHLLRKVCHGKDGKPSSSTIVASPVVPGDEHCPAGGTKVARFDDLDGNGVYAASTDANLSESWVCQGSDAVLVLAEVAPSSGECPNLGGQRFETFTDKDGNGVFDAARDINRSVRFVCHRPMPHVLVVHLNPDPAVCGSGGKLLRTFLDVNGSKSFESGIDTDYEEKKVCNGVASGVVQTVLPPHAAGSPCGALGGVMLETFRDENLSGAYESGTDTGHQSQALCAGASGKNSIVLQEQINPGGTTCPQGGYTYRSFIDLNGNLLYDSEVDSNYHSSSICNGASARIIKSAIAVGDPACPSGGAAYDVFVDVNGNGTFDSGVDTNRTQQNICNGQNGGVNGSNAVVLTTSLPVGHATCASGGVQVETFTDVNGNGSFDEGTDLNRQTRLVCNGATGAAGSDGLHAVSVQTTLPVGDASCPNGGARYQVFTDVNRNGNYDSGIDTYSSQHVICNGINGHAMRIGLTPFGTGTGNCSGRSGMFVQTWLDLNDNGSYDVASESGTLTTQTLCDGVAGATGTTGATGADGISRGLTISIVAPGTLGAVAGQPGVNCTEGGLRYTTWAEIGVPDNVMQAGESASSTSLYVCNARRQIMKSTAFAAGAGSASDNSACPYGGVRLEFGLDDFDTGGGAIGALDAAEVNAALTQRVCHGANAGRNLLINGDMRIDQRNSGSAGTAAAYAVDRWAYHGTQGGKVTWQRNAGGVTPPPGFTDYLGFTTSSAFTAAATDYFVFHQVIEGYNIAPLAFGTTSAKTVTLSFRVRSSLTGTFGGSLSNDTGTRSYPFAYTISAANTWEYKSITIPGETSGSWKGNNDAGMHVRFGLGSGGNWMGSAGAWSTSNLIQPTGTQSVVATLGASFYITGIQLEAASAATPFEHRDIGLETTLCERYFEVIPRTYFGVSSTPAGAARYVFPFRTLKRTTASIAYILGIPWTNFISSTTSSFTGEWVLGAPGDNRLDVSFSASAEF